MARGTRLDAPGSIHHVMVRGIEGRAIYRDEKDRQDFLDRLGMIVAETQLAVLAWALMANHAHLVVRTGLHPLASAMQRLGTGYVRCFNARYRRRGHLFQGRYKSILVEEDVQLLAVVRYVHRNPLEAGIVSSVRELARYPWSGHAVLMGHREARFQAVEAILSTFGGSLAEARARLSSWMAEPDTGEVVPDRAGRCGGGPENLSSITSGSPLHRDASILGRDGFAEEVLRGFAWNSTLRVAVRRRGWELDRLVSHVCQALGADASQVELGRRGRAESDARAAIAYLGRRELGIPFTRMAAQLGVSSAALGQAAERGRRVVRSAGIALA